MNARANLTKTHTAGGALWNGCSFQFSNALCFEIFLGPPLLVYAQSLGASAITAGLLAGMTPLMSPLQLAAAGPAARCGFARWVRRGWLARTCLILLVAAMALPAWKGGGGWRITALLGISAVYCAWLQVISVGWLPWINSLLDERTRGWYLAREQGAILLGGLLTVGLSAILLWLLPGGLGFFTVFLWSFAGGVLGWWFVRRVPEPAVKPELPEELVGEKTWRRAWETRPFRWLVACNLLWIFAQGALVVHGLAFMQERMAVGEAGCVAAVMCLYAGGLAAMLLAARRIDAWAGSWLAGAAWTCVAIEAVAWLLVAVRDIPMPVPVFAGLFFLQGMGVALFMVALMRELMRVVPRRRSERFFACHSVLASGAMWLAPVGWGVVLEWSGRSGAPGPLPAGSYAIFYGGVLGLLLVLAATLRPGAIFSPGTALEQTA